MAYDEGLATRIRELLGERRDVTEKAMFRGLAFLVGGNMCVAVSRDELLVRVGAERHDEALARPHARVMDFTGRPMTGWVYVAAEGLESDDDLAGWLAWGVAIAEAAPKKAKVATKPPAKAKKKAARPAKPTPTPKTKIGKAAAKRQPSGRRR